ncbi:MAG: FtsX-like permease family protein [Mogibacterium sp.]|nr:FtsX-like permease family protein [Mogibacterium sp.]
MKKTQLTDALRNIRKRIVSYLSICLVVMLGVGAFLCTRYMETGIIREAAGYYQDRSFKDFELISSLGASDSNIESIKAADGVVDAEGVMEYEGSLQKGDFKKNVTVLSCTERVSVPLLVDGRLPSASDECAIGEDFSEESGIKTGDTVTIYLTSSGDDDPLHGHQYMVTGLMKHPDYVHRKLTSTVVLPLSAFDMSVTENAYMRVFVRANDVAPDDTFTQAYFDQTADTKKALEDLTGKLSADRAKEIQDEAYAKIDEEWAKALAELEDAEKEISDGEAELASKLKSGRKELKDAEKTLANKLAEANRKIRNGELSIREGEKKLAEAKAELEKNKDAYATIKGLFEDETGWVEAALEDVNVLLTYLDDPASLTEEERRNKELDLAQKLLDQRDNIQAVIDYSKTDEAMEDAKELEALTGQPVVLYVTLLRFTDADTILSSATNVMESDEAHFSKDELEIMKDVFNAILQVRSQFEDAEKSLKDAEKQINDGMATLRQKKGELNAAKKQLKSEKKAAEKKIKDGWSKYYSMKASYESKLEEAKALLAENREEAEAKLAEAKADVGEIDCDWIVLDRNANAGYVDVKVQLDSLRSTGMVFGVLFILITALVCFSTLTIIIEEQKKLIGTVKAFGFHKSEVLKKYLLFGLSAGILGDILAVFTGYGLSEIVQTVYSASNLYQYGRPASIMRPVPTILISLAMLLVCAVASILACTEVLRKPASALMSGQSLRKSTRKTVSSGRKGTLYSRLILRNIRDDKARVIVSTAIVAFCCMLIGVGLSFKLATTGMLARQEGDINRFDIRMDMGSSVTDEQRAEMIALLDAKGVDHTEAVYQSCLFNTGSTITGMTMLAGDPDVLNKYFGMDSTDIRSELTSDGVIIPVRMSENYGYTDGDTVSLLDSAMQKHEAPVTGTYTCYFGRTVVTTPEGYSKIFEDEFDPNSSFMHLNGADAQALKNELLAINDDISFEGKSDFRTSFESVGALYNIIVYVTMGVALFMSFMILTNLANIFLTRKKNELIVMRVNGFSIKQTKGYLTREAVLTTVVGLALGVLVGSLLTPYAVRILEPADLQFDRSYHAISWIIAGGIEGLFALIIYSTVFRRVKHFNLKDIAS